MATTSERPKTEAAVPVRWTREEYHLLAETGVFAMKRVQLVDGEIVEMPPMRPPHVRASRYLERLFASLRSDADDRVFIDKPLIVDGDNEPEPDLTITRPGVAAVPHVEDAALVIEITQSNRRYDLGAKLERYLASGVAELWIIDLVQRCVLVYRGGELAARHTQGAGASLSANAVPEVTLQVDALFAAVDSGS
jgi:Uma2 family endonuclease